MLIVCWSFITQGTESLPCWPRLSMSMVYSAVGYSASRSQRQSTQTYRLSVMVCWVPSQ